MKVCKVLIGPIAGEGGVNRNEGEEIVLDDATAALFAGWKYVEILDDDEVAEPPLSESGLGGLKDGQDLADGGEPTPNSVGVAALKELLPTSSSTEPEVKQSGKSRTKVAG